MEPFTKEEKQDIAKQIKNITMEQVEKDYAALLQIGANAKNQSERCRTGNNVVDFFTFEQRLETRGKYDVNYFEFVKQIETFKKKKFIQTMLFYYEREKNKNKTKNKWIVLKEVYNICISAINIIRPLVYMEIFYEFNPTCVLDFCAGWGGAAVAASVCGVNYIGIEINRDLEEPYSRLLGFLQAQAKQEEKEKEKEKTSNIKMFFQSALDMDYSLLHYDLVFTSPPYYFIQKYKNNVTYPSKQEMDDLFYKPLFQKTFQGLQKGGHYVLNVNNEVYKRVCIDLLGEAHSTFCYKKSKRQNEYKEQVYVWKKNI